MASRRHASRMAVYGGRKIHQVVTSIRTLFCPPPGDTNRFVLATGHSLLARLGLHPVEPAPDWTQRNLIGTLYCLLPPKTFRRPARSAS